MSTLITLVFTASLGFFLGLLLFPMVLFLRARRDSAWDNSNMTNIYRLVAHIATHPGDFGKLSYLDKTGGKVRRYPFWYINKDEITDVVKSRVGINDEQ